MFNIENVLGMEVCVAWGENDFTMSRGSFKYKQRIGKKTKLQLTKKTAVENGFELEYTGGDERCVFVVTEVDGKLRLESKFANTNDMNRYWLTFAANPAEHIYGCGETYSEFDLKGQNVRVWVAEHQNAARISKKIIKDTLRGKRPEKTLPFDKYESYYAQPTFVSSDKYYVHCDINAYSEFDFTKADKMTLYFQEPPVIISESADSFEDLSEKETELLGRQVALPEWLYEGGIIAMQDWIVDGKDTKEGFDGCGNIDRKLAKLDEAGVKVNGVWCQDWCGCRCTGFGYQVMWNWRYDEKQYANLPDKIKEWNARGVKFLGYINPFIALEKDIYEEAKAKGYCVKDKEGNDYLVTITTFPAAMVDFTNPEAYEWYKNLIKKNMIGIGMGGWMADFGEYLPIDAVLYSGEDAAELHNRWPAIWAKLNREAIEESGKLGEVFFFTRAGHTETIKYSTMMWTGDQHVDWSVDDGMPSVIPATLSLAMSGYGITHSDVGGYTTIMNMTRSKELLLRWTEMNAFSPIFRSHEGNQPSRDVQLCDDDELLAQLARFTQIHVGLTGYIKSLVKKQNDKGTPVMLPLFYYYDEDAAYTEKSEYLFGRDMLVAPILKEKATSRQVYLPRDRWIHLFTGQEYTGGKYTIDAPIGQPPIFVRADSDMYDEIMAAAGR
ncbi:MAG: alpha-glucosidase [Lachnospiraceae bacterium]|nr:alpha-glucosidase [Lachnospiraceae bacterium]